MSISDEHANGAPDSNADESGTQENDQSGFTSLGLPDVMLETISRLGYETPSPIQARTIPLILEGSDVVGMAQTGTGKTAAFALPILAKIDTSSPHIQALVLCPTRELALQVSEAFQTYSASLGKFHVLPVYGGQDMRAQLKALKRGPHVIVATPGRLLDHLERRSLDLSHLQTLVLDEADEMLRMGFIDDVETILEKTPADRQVVLFSATMPQAIRRVAEKYLRKPTEVRIESKATTGENISQFFWLVRGMQKLDALTRILEVETFDGMIIFVRTKTATVELADKLNARGFNAAALNGDIVQAQRQRTVEQLKEGRLDILVATDVAARGLDVDRISHVINYDIPYDNEAYVHRIGRTGRAGRTGKAILFVAPRERNMLRSIERTTRQQIPPLELPSRDDLIAQRIDRFKAEITSAIDGQDLAFFQQIVEDLCREKTLTELEVAAALAYLQQKERPLRPKPEREERSARQNAEWSQDATPRGARQDNDRGSRSAAAPRTSSPDAGMARYRVEVGHQDGVSPGELVGAIANESGIEGRYIGKIQIYNTFTTIDLPAEMPAEVATVLQRTRVRQKPLNIGLFDGEVPANEIGGDTRKPRRRNESNAAGQRPPRRDKGGYGGDKGRSDSSQRPPRKPRD